MVTISFIQKRRIVLDRVSEIVQFELLRRVNVVYTYFLLLSVNKVGHKKDLRDEMMKIGNPIFFLSLL